MTDNEIIKALEWLERLKRDTDVSEWAESLEIILNEYNRQRVEIERLNIELQSMRSAANSYKMHYEKAQTEIERLQKNIDGLNIFTKNHIKVIRLQAIKEFVEKFAKALSEFDISSVGLPDYDRGYKDCMTAIEDTIDSLVKMTEEEE